MRELLIREAVEADTRAIVELLKLSLGESLMPKSELFWRWKHFANPFGPSSVLLAFEGESLVGVRAFMRWDWRANDNVIKSMRAVDTATHPSHQGKGIFRKLTLRLVESCEEMKLGFIFNTPNKKSKPGYLKMGWSEVGRLPIRLRPFLNVFSAKLNAGGYFAVNQNQLISFFNQFPELLNSSLNGYFTNRSLSFLIWRYVENPNVNYSWFHDADGRYAVIYRLKSLGKFVEFRICEFFKSDNLEISSFRNHLLQVVSESGASIITYAGHMPPFRGIILPVGPVVTARPIGANSFPTFHDWGPTLGDLEVF